uniref:PXA domain-containing protein n=1 Tax=Trichuris muris TaxID=70415 RepID=A0A5S6QNQ0_TRIMR
MATTGQPVFVSHLWKPISERSSEGGRHGLPLPFEVPFLVKVRRKFCNGTFVMGEDKDASQYAPTEGSICAINQGFGILRLLKSGKLCAVVAALLAVQSFGLYGCYCIALCAIFFLSGCLLRLFFYTWNVRYPLLLAEFETLDWTTERKLTFPKLRAVAFDKNAKLPCSENMEKLINEIVDFTLRDYVASWYSKLTNDDGFLKSVRSLIITALRVLIVNLKNVNFVTLLTHDVIDDFATHLKLFRKAKQKCEKTVSAGGEARSDLLEQYFFEMEYELESNFCRKRLCMSEKGEKEFLRSLADILVYLLLPTKDLSPHVFRLLLRDMLAVQVIGASVNLICDPDYICHTVASLLFAVPLKYEDFISILEATEDADELNGTMESLQQEIELQRSKDTGGADDSFIKQQLGSLFYLQKLIGRRLSRLQTSDSNLDEGGDSWQDCAAMYDLSLAFVLCNHVALCSFIDYLSQTDGKSYIDMYLTVEGFKNSFPHLSSGASSEQAKGNESLIISSAREVALEIYNQYFQTNSDRLVDIDESIKKRLQAMIRSKVHPSFWFDEAQQRAYEILENDIRFYPSFKRSYAYVKLLAELKLLLPQDKVEENNPFAVASAGSVLDDQADAGGAESVLIKDVRYETNIKTIGMGNEHSSIFAVYNIEVKRFDHHGECVKHWIVTRRYSDFYNLNCVIKRKFPQLAKISFPAKKTFNNMQHGFLERRKRALNTYLRTLLDPALLKRCKGLEKLLLEFLCKMDYNGDGGTLVEKLNSVVDPIRSGVKFVGNAVISMPDTLIDGVCKVGDGLGKVTRTVFGIHEPTPQVENFGGRVAASLSYGSADSIPLRILMLLVDEIFGLQEQNQWIRRRMVSFLQQLIHAMYGSSLNRKIVEYVHWLTSEEQVINYIKLFKNSMWPNGMLAEAASPRPQSTKARTRVVARAQTLSLLPDEFKLFIGNDTTTAGVCMVFEALQHKSLNRRLCYVLLERIIVSAFPNRNVDQVIPVLLRKYAT